MYAILDYMDKSLLFTLLVLKLEWKWVRVFWDDNVSVELCMIAKRGDKHVTSTSTLACTTTLLTIMLYTYDVIIYAIFVTNTVKIRYNGSLYIYDT